MSDKQKLARTDLIASDIVGAGCWIHPEDPVRMLGQRDSFGS